MSVLRVAKSFSPVIESGDCASVDRGLEDLLKSDPARGEMVFAAQHRVSSQLRGAEVKVRCSLVGDTERVPVVIENSAAVRGAE